MKKLFLISSIAALGFAYSVSTVMPYGSLINYSGSTYKDDAKLGGVYASYYKWPFKLEVDGEFLKIDYKNNLHPWLQRDFTFKANYYYKQNWLCSGGIHNFWIQQNSDYKYNKVFFAGLDYYQYLKYNEGIDFYYSKYQDFDVKQASLKYGINFGNYYSYDGAFYFECKYNYIHISEKDIAPDDNYHNFDLKLQNFKGPWTTTLKATLGRFAYKVANDGFVVYNTGNEYKYGYGISINYVYNKVNSIKVSFDRSEFKEGGNSHSNTYLISYSRAF
jgi:hypothetical protein